MKCSLWPLLLPALLAAAPAPPRHPRPARSHVGVRADLLLAPVKLGGKWGYVDRTGRYAINPQFDEALAFDGATGLAPVKLDKWGYIDRSGHFVVNPQFDKARPFDPATGLAAVKADGKWGFIDATGHYAINPQFDEVEGHCFH